MLADNLGNVEKKTPDKLMAVTGIIENKIDLNKIHPDMIAETVSSLRPYKSGAAK